MKGRKNWRVKPEKLRNELTFIDMEGLYIINKFLIGNQSSASVDKIRAITGQSQFSVIMYQLECTHWQIDFLFCFADCKINKLMSVPISLANVYHYICIYDSLCIYFDHGVSPVSSVRSLANRHYGIGIVTVHFMTPRQEGTSKITGNFSSASRRTRTGISN